MNRRIETMNYAQAKAYRARMRRFHARPLDFDGKMMMAYFGVWSLARAMAYIADAVEGGPHA